MAGNSFCDWLQHDCCVSAVHRKPQPTQDEEEPPGYDIFYQRMSRQLERCQVDPLLVDSGFMAGNQLTLAQCAEVFVRKIQELEDRCEEERGTSVYDPSWREASD